MENKYYTPRIEEFYVGFECEFKNNMQSGNWEKEVCNTDLIFIAFDSYEHSDSNFDPEESFENEFRVKYLDKEDIESLGFIFIKHHPGTNTFSFEFNEYFLDVTFDFKNKIHVRIYEGDYENEFNYFTGFIKNKSELKKVLKTLKIIE